MAETISVTSLFPTKVDDMSFFCDIDLERKLKMDKYRSLILQGKYDEAEKLANETPILFGYMAKYFNLIENRIETTQSYFKYKKRKSVCIFGRRA